MHEFNPLGGCIFMIVLWFQRTVNSRQDGEWQTDLEVPTHQRTPLNEKAALCFGSIKEFQVPHYAELSMTPHHAEESSHLMRNYIRSFHLLGFEDGGWSLEVRLCLCMR
jgi:hypothetical protein